MIVSDNGKTFKDSRVQAQCQRDGTQWKFNVEAAPWWGGFFERLVKIGQVEFEEVYTKCSVKL